MTHSEQKPHKCSHCSKTFIRADKMRKHEESKHGNAMGMVAPKQEHMMAAVDVKRESFPF